MPWTEETDPRFAASSVPPAVAARLHFLSFVRLASLDPTLDLRPHSVRMIPGLLSVFVSRIPGAVASRPLIIALANNNADAHLKRQIMGREVVVAITKGKLDLGPWEQIFHGEFDGRRRKRVLVKIVGE